MRKGSLIQYPSGRYYQGYGVIGGLGREAALLGKRALIVAETALWDRFAPTVRESLAVSQIECRHYAFKGLCCPTQYEAAAAYGRAEGCDLVIGLGGGRALDTAKIASDKLGVRAITVPTSAATCAATAWLSVHYREDGTMIGNYWTRYAPFATFAELQFILDACPRRYLLAGVIDAMAKYPEITYNIRKGTLYERNAFSMTAAAVAADMFDTLLEKGLSAARDDAPLDVKEDVIAYSLNVAGLTSALACGGRQAAVSHQLYAYVCGRYPEITARYLHGEIVGASLVYQLRLIDAPDERINQLEAFLKAAGAPARMADLGLPQDEDTRQRLFDHLRTALPVESEMEMARLTAQADWL